MNAFVCPCEIKPVPSTHDYGVSGVARSYHPGGTNTLLGDGSVRFAKTTIDGMVWRALGTVGGGEVISSDVY